ncbi:hypothetical protein RKE30_16330 [Streptomyces sp. Li-HN-5-11]|uniref:hypothetical protein n=1 Tax=Streptomyces sp. Li-HN-5-11 TaxID=3075432 RepID=UPI0028A8ECF5|nr:hypothetical protein [Streptomyces sp. Li-HN-5-11]WNM31862.1 hypothetical protein RKE30_16330 [Streptomyces sp. Li-HN-5-11]
MQRGMFLVGAVGCATAVVALGGLNTCLLSGTESTTGLDDHSTVSVDGHRELAAGVVAGRTKSNYHPLSWGAVKLSGVTCPSGPKAVTGVPRTCSRPCRPLCAWQGCRSLRSGSRLRSWLHAGKGSICDHLR